MRNLEVEMANDPVVIGYLEDYGTAIAFYSALCNRRWMAKPQPEDEAIINRLKGEPEFWSCTWRYAGGIIADIRNKHYNRTEDYSNFYCTGNEGMVSNFVAECFGRMGWTSEKW